MVWLSDVIVPTVVANLTMVLSLTGLSPMRTVAQTSPVAVLSSTEIRAGYAVNSTVSSLSSDEVGATENAHPAAPSTVHIRTPAHERTRLLT